MPSVCRDRVSCLWSSSRHIAWRNSRMEHVGRCASWCCIARITSPELNSYLEEHRLAYLHLISNVSMFLLTLRISRQLQQGQPRQQPGQPEPVRRCRRPARPARVSQSAIFACERATVLPVGGPVTSPPPHPPNPECVTKTLIDPRLSLASLGVCMILRHILRCLKSAKPVLYTDARGPIEKKSTERQGRRYIEGNHQHMGRCSSL